MTQGSISGASFVLERLAVALRWVRLREDIRILKESGVPGPWVNDMPLTVYRFCNVRRRHDRVSRWLLNNLYTEEEQEDPDFWLVPCIARMINWPPTLLRLYEESLLPRRGRWDPEKAGAMVDKLSAVGKAWTGAYIVTAVKLHDGEKKGSWLARKSWAPLWEGRKQWQRDLAQPGLTVQNAVQLFTGWYGFGPAFMAGQVAADWSYTRILRNAPDLFTWASRGPGSLQGANWLMGRDINRSMPEEEFLDALKTFRQAILLRWPEFEDTTMHDIQNCFCEVSKYARALENRGRPRSLYVPETRF